MQEGLINEGSFASDMEKGLFLGGGRRGGFTSGFSVLLSKII